MTNGVVFDLKKIQSIGKRYEIITVFALDQFYRNRLATHRRI